MEKDIPVTMAIRALRAAKVAFIPRRYEYVEHGGTRHAAEVMGLNEHAVVKTIILEDEDRKPLVMLMHGDREISTKQLARVIGKKSVSPCAPETANRHTGYFVGGTSPFGTRKKMPVYAEATLFSLPLIYINGGHRGIMVEIAPAVLDQMLSPTHVNVARD